MKYNTFKNAIIFPYKKNTKTIQCECRTPYQFRSFFTLLLACRCCYWIVVTVQIKTIRRMLLLFFSITTHRVNEWISWSEARDIIFVCYALTTSNFRLCFFFFFIKNDSTEFTLLDDFWIIFSFAFQRTKERREKS